MGNPWIIAHRGASGYAPENTLAAFERAVALGAGFIETDIRLTRDARFVAMHDETLDRTTNGHGEVQQHTLADLRELDTGHWFDREFNGQRIPTLEQILEFGKKHDVIFYLEMKFDTAMGMHHSLVAELRRTESAARTIVISFDPRMLASLRALDASIMTGLLVDRGVAAETAVKKAVDAGARQLCPHYSIATPKLVNAAHDVGLQVVAWTVNELSDMRTVIASGVDGIMTDLPDRLRAMLEGPDLDLAH
jgi:glycerophosphoryl diester phosphodiesterase